MTPQEKRELLAWKADLLHLKIKAAQKRRAAPSSGSLLANLTDDVPHLWPMLRAVAMLPRRRVHRLLLNAFLLYFWPNRTK